jgi:hypothetical protein
LSLLDAAHGACSIEKNTEEPTYSFIVYQLWRYFAFILQVAIVPIFCDGFWIPVALAVMDRSVCRVVGPAHEHAAHGKVRNRKTAVPCYPGIG